MWCLKSVFVLLFCPLLHSHGLQGHLFKVVRYRLFRHNEPHSFYKKLKYATWNSRVFQSLIASSVSWCQLIKLNFKTGPDSNPTQHLGEMCAGDIGLAAGAHVWWINKLLKLLASSLFIHTVNKPRVEGIKAVEQRRKLHDKFFHKHWSCLQFECTNASYKCGTIFFF